MPISRTVKGSLFATIWVVVGGAISAEMVERFWLYSIGGVFTPPATWTFFRDLGVTLIHALLTLGGVPAAMEIVRARPWKAFALISFGICVLAYSLVQLVLVWGPCIFGWTW